MIAMGLAYTNGNLVIAMCLISDYKGFGDHTMCLVSDIKLMRIW